VHQQRVALARQLAAQAELTRNQEGNLLPRSVALAAESMRRYPSLEADLPLRTGLTLLPRPGSFMKHAKGIWTVAYSPDGKFVATGVTMTHAESGKS
jgi:uncharacterized iron-regulated membrane protein